jgi:hypothetical protein
MSAGAGMASMRSASVRVGRLAAQIGVEGVEVGLVDQIRLAGTLMSQRNSQARR